MSSSDRLEVNRDLLLQRIQEIRDALSDLRRDAGRAKDEFVSDRQAVDACKYRLVVAIEAAVSICMHLSSRLAARTPESYAACFESMRDAGMLPEDLTARLGRMARFRNRLVHLYWQIDSARLWTILQENLGDLDAYLAAVGDVLAGPGPVEPSE